MTRPNHPLELLAPAKNADFGIAAINHGADAVYIGGPAFGARANAGNTLADIERLSRHAHRFNAKVFVALNTILRDDELDEARQMAWQAYESGADALIVQDMGLLEMDLPPIQLHASTQTDNRNPAKVKFLEDAGFSQVVLARELSMKEVAAIAAQTNVALEYFVHGALCVAFSGQCFISHAHTGRSANRGECSQACRLPYTLVDDKGKTITENQHLLSMKDNNQSNNVLALAQAGVSSFKIEGRYKDLSYVKNITAHYRTLLDEVLTGHPEFHRASSGHSTYTFTPQPEKTYNRGYTDYFANDRQDDIGAFDAAGFVGEAIGEVTEIGPNYFMVNAESDFNNGDGVCFYDAHAEVVGFRINRAEGRKLFPVTIPEGLTEGATLFRNHDQAFERALEKESAERLVSIQPLFAETPDGFALTLTDEDGISATVNLKNSENSGKEIAKNPERATATLIEQLGKFGNTMFTAQPAELQLSQAWFLPTGAINALRREATEKLELARLAAYQRPPRAEPAANPVPYPQEELTYLGNVFNAKARQFYEKHGVKLIADAYEANEEKGMVSLMITRHCLRFSFNLCPKEVKHLKPDPMTLVNGSEKLILKFDCKACEMHVIGKMKKGVTLNLGTIRPL
ncbi:MAG: U32 family peptidase [Azonexus sp.]|nr:U32 family peptidase [Azonexus sp.]MDZ4313445.1 U32 family peptidase [Azonexus sp.]